MAAANMSTMDRCKRYLRYNLDGQTYKVLGTCCTAEKSDFVKTAIEQGMGKDILAEIEKLYNEDKYIRLNVLIFVTAMCSKSNDITLKQEAYKTFLKICKRPRAMFTFIVHVRDLTDAVGRGWGRSLRRAISQWYNEQPLMELAEKVTREVSYAGWCHLDVLRLGHIKASNDGESILFNF